MQVLMQLNLVYMILDEVVNVGQSSMQDETA